MGKGRRWLLSLVLLGTLLAVPAVALAAGTCAGVSGSDTGKFQEILEKHGAFVAVLLSFGFGFLASLTPCVYPMVPITVSIFGATEAKSRWRGAALSGAFVLGIATLFTPMGIASALSGRLLGGALSNTWVVVGFALLFGALAASMFGAFELALPSSLTNKLSTVGGVGYKGAFVMGLAMGVIAAPCTGPFLTGIVTVIATTKNIVLGAAALFSFALGLGVLFFIAGAFALNLPKGGAWMMGIKWASGVGLAFMSFAYLRDKFPAVRQLVNHGSYTFGAVAGGLLLVGLGLGLVHILAERRKSSIAHLSKPMKLASLVPAITGAAMFFTWITLSHDVAASDGASANANVPAAPAIPWYTDEAKALAKSKEEGKPVLIDFGATWCPGCKELDEHTFPDEKVRAEAQRFVALRVDATDDDDEEVQRLRQKYGVLGLPTVIMLDATGNELLRFTEFVAPDKFSEALRCQVSGKPAKSSVVGMSGGSGGSSPAESRRAN